jgi:hypothetical protein
MIKKIVSSRLLQVLASLLFVLLISGCARYGHVVFEDESGTVSVEVDRGTSQGRYQGRYESRLPEIPPGHMPPPGKCRIWFPGEPPGKQPPPGECKELRHQVPPGAWLVRG